MGNTGIIVAAEENKNLFEIKICYCFQYCEGLYKRAEILLLICFF